MKRYNLGSGMLPIPGWINVDVRDDWDGVDIVADVRRLDLLEDGCADEVFAKDVLEHMPRTEWRSVLDEWTRLLRPGGLLKIRFPDVLKLYDAYLRGNFKPSEYSKNPDNWDEKELKRWGFERFGQLLFGDQNVPENAHLSCLSDWLVRDYLESIGMVMVKEWKDGCCDIRFTASKGKVDESLSLDHPDYALR